MMAEANDIKAVMQDNSLSKEKSKLKSPASGKLRTQRLMRS